MDQEPKPTTQQSGQTPPCLKVGAAICRGCPGWEAMLAAIAPGGPWRGALIHCPCCGLTVRSADPSAGDDAA